MNIGDFRVVSLEFRRISSNFLDSKRENADINLRRFVKYLDSNEFVRNILKEKIGGVEFDYNECFRNGRTSSARGIVIPEDEGCHIRACYDYMQDLSTCERGVLSEALSYHFGSRKYDDIIQEFFSVIGKPIIDYVIDRISMQMITLEEEQKAEAMRASFCQNITGNSGTINIQGSGTINSTNTISVDLELQSQIERAIEYLSTITGVSKEEVDDVRDDLEQVREQLTSDTPKKNRIKKALDGIKKFAYDTGQKTMVSLAAKTIIVNWDAIIQGIQNLIK